MDHPFGDMPHLPTGFKQAALNSKQTDHVEWTDPAELVQVARLGGLLGDYKIFI